MLDRPARIASQQLIKAGHTQVANLRGGLGRWITKGYPLAGARVS